MLTPAQIRDRKFISSVRGTYKSEDVDVFIEEICVSYEQILRENSELVRKISLLAEKVEEYRNDEDSIKTAILTAQKVADKIIGEADKDAESKRKSGEEKLAEAQAQASDHYRNMIQEAEDKAKDMLLDASIKASDIIAQAQQQAEDIRTTAESESVDLLERIKTELVAETTALNLMKKDAEAFKNELMEQYNRHIAYIEELPGAVLSIASKDAAKQYSDIETAPSAATDEDDEVTTGESFDGLAVDDAEPGVEYEGNEEQTILTQETAEASETETDDVPENEDTQEQEEPAEYHDLPGETPGDPSQGETGFHVSLDSFNPSEPVSDTKDSGEDKTGFETVEYEAEDEEDDEEDEEDDEEDDASDDNSPPSGFRGFFRK